MFRPVIFLTQRGFLKTVIPQSHRFQYSICSNLDDLGVSPALRTPINCYNTYPLVNQHSYGKSPCLIGKSTIKWPFSIAMLVYQRVRNKLHWPAAASSPRLRLPHCMPGRVPKVEDNTVTKSATVLVVYQL